MIALAPRWIDKLVINYQKVLLVIGLSVCGGSAHAAESVQALRYGVTLFHFYQQDYFASLTELMTAQQLQQLGNHNDNAELLRGGMSLSYGMDNEAEKIFQAMLSEPRDDVDRDRVWFYLAKLSWQRGNLDRAEYALDEVAVGYQGPLADEVNYLRAAISLRRGDEGLAITHAALLPENSPWLNYFNYNMGAARAARADWPGALEYFHRLTLVSANSSESKALQDKALTASGFAQLASGELALAAQEFIQVRLESPLADRAMLGYGWALSELEDYRGALSPWKALSARSLMSESVRESLLAIPFAYEQLGKYGVALDNYRFAAEVYAAELENVRKAIEVFGEEDLKTLFALDSGGSGEWLSGGDILPVNEQAPYLSHLITRHSFQMAMRELRDLQRTVQQLSQAQARLEVLTQVDADQQRSWSSVMEGDRKSILSEREQLLRTKVNKLREKFDRAEAAQDMRFFADTEQSDMWQRLGRAQELARKLGASPVQKQKLNLFSGLLLWEDSQQYAARSWEVKGQLQSLEAAGLESQAHLQNVERAIASRQEASFAPRIVGLGERVSEQRVRAELALADSEGKIRHIAVNELERQSRQLTRALGQSRLAMARLYDIGSPEVPR